MAKNLLAKESSIFQWMFTSLAKWYIMIEIKLPIKHFKISNLNWVSALIMINKTMTQVMINLVALSHFDLTSIVML